MQQEDFQINDSWLSYDAVTVIPLSFDHSVLV